MCGMSVIENSEAQQHFLSEAMEVLTVTTSYNSGKRTLA